MSAIYGFKASNEYAAAAGMQNKSCIHMDPKYNPLICMFLPNNVYLSVSACVFRDQNVFVFALKCTCAFLCLVHRLCVFSSSSCSSSCCCSSSSFHFHFILLLFY